jgi:hypothetical protein
MKMRMLAVAVVAGLFTVAPTRSAPAGVVSLDLSTGAGTSWRVTGGGAVNAVAGLTGNNLTLTSNGLAGGTPVTGFNNANFDGYWVADFTFSLPADATGVTLGFDNLFADDRTVLTLNGAQIGNFGDNGPAAGMIVLTDGAPETPFTFTNASSGTVTSGFTLGAVNTLEAIVNNTTGGITGQTAPLAGTNGTDFGVIGTLAYATGGGAASAPTASAVPLPPAAWTGLVTLLGIVGIGWYRPHAGA